MSGVRHAAVLGHPVAHSLSPVLHRAAYRHLGLHWTYDAVDVNSDDLAGFLGGLDAAWVGLSLTMPLKEAVLPLLTGVDAEAAALTSVNTVLLGPGEQRRGFNTDVAGLQGALADGDAPTGTAAAVLGGGATARSALAALARHGAADVTVCVRRPEAGEQLTRLGRALGVSVRSAPFTRAAEALAAPLVVSTVPADAARSLGEALPLRPGLLVDVVYHPWPTGLAQAWVGHGGRVVGGLAMLVHQAVEQVRLMTGREVPVDLLRGAGEEALAARG